MGKIVKYCAACDESFAEKFAFCPNCGKTMQAFEMNPLAAAEIAAEKANVGAANGNGAYKTETTAPLAPETFARIEPVKVSEPPIAAPVEKTPAAVVKETVSSDMKAVEPAKTTAPVKETETFAATDGNGYQSQTSNDGYRTVASRKYENAGGFNVTVIEEKNTKQRNLLLLGAMLFLMTLAAGGMIYSLFNYNLSIAAIGDESGLAMPIDEVVPMAVEDETPKPKDDKDAGGGGGGGRDEPTPTSQGRLATQTEKPLIAPDKSIVQKDFELKQPVASTQGNKVIKPTDQAYGDPNARAGLSSSNGMGTGGGQGSGIGTGQGSGRGTGAGSGIGSGFGAGEGDGNGNGRGSGNQGIAAPPAPPEPKKAAVAVVSEPIKIISKPRANYTDAARTNQVTGVVRVRVQFLASGQVGSISAVSGLPYGLTEQAIAAAKSIKFEPMKKNGVAVGTSKVIEYSFTIY